MSQTSFSLPELPTAQTWVERCNNDGEFKIAARYFTGVIRLNISEQVVELGVENGLAIPAMDSVNRSSGPEDGLKDGLKEGLVELSATEDFWSHMLAAKPPRFFTDLLAAVNTGSDLALSGDRLAYAQYYGAVMRAIELLRPASSRPLAALPAGRKFDAPTGRYVHLQLGGLDHRIYFEEAGQGIPVLLQHTAGCHGSQWRHLMEDPRLTEKFRLIAYDLPYHGKSLPPVEKSWWAERYELEGEFLRSVPCQLAKALELDQPVFIGCSVGGLLALDLAHKHADLFRAVVSVEGALNIPGDLKDFGHLWHPQISNDYKARTMEGLMAPESPLAYVKETSFVYASGWPQSFIGDLHYYVTDYDLRDHAGDIDTSRVGVHIMSGEYDHSGTAELGKQASDAIAGSSWIFMEDVGHFPMSENPQAFIDYLLPILDTIGTDS